jgi:hypothetical protein
MRRMNGSSSLAALLCVGLIHAATASLADATSDEGKRSVVQPMSQTTVTPPVTTGRGTKD